MQDWHKPTRPESTEYTPPEPDEPVHLAPVLDVEYYRRAAWYWRYRYELATGATPGQAARYADMNRDAGVSAEYVARLRQEGSDE